MVESFVEISGIRVHIVKFRPVRWQGLQPLFLPPRENIGKERIEVKKSVMIIPMYVECASLLSEIALRPLQTPLAKILENRQGRLLSLRLVSF